MGLNGTTKPIKIFNSFPDGRPSVVAPVARTDEESIAIKSLSEYIQSHSPKSLINFHKYYNENEYQPPRYENYWELSGQLPNWAAPLIVPETIQLQPIYAIRTNAIEQENHLVYIAYTLDNVNLCLGIVREMHPDHVSQLLFTTFNTETFRALKLKLYTLTQPRNVGKNVQQSHMYIY